MRSGRSPSSVALLGGTGDLGVGLALRLARAGATVTIGSRDLERAKAVAAKVRAVAGGSVAGRRNTDAASDADIAVISVPFAAQAAVLKDAAKTLASGQIVVDATVPLATALGGTPTRTLSVWSGSAAQQAREIVGDAVGMTSGLHTVSAASLADLDQRLDEDVLLCGDRAADKKAVADLIETIPGLRCVDVGRLEMARVLEQLAPLLISVNRRHRAHAGIKITGLPGVATNGAASIND